MEELERYGKILRDGICVSKKNDTRVEKSFEMGKDTKLETTIQYRDGIIYSKMIRENGKHKRTLVFYPDGKTKVVDIAIILMPTEDTTKKDTEMRIIQEFYKSGNLKREEKYTILNGDFMLLNRNHFTEEGNDTLFTEPYMRLPSFPGGNRGAVKFLSENIEYPDRALEEKIEGSVVVEFVVGKDGSISNIQVAKSLNKYLDEEAVRVIKKMNGWKPGIQYGEPVEAYHTLRVVFGLHNESF
ncbi:MAG: energy transducer TonB [Tannerella sp.]|nr:energy transducer TonB [Tannerella sp.]